MLIHCWRKYKLVQHQERLEVSYKTKHNLIIQFSNCSSRYLPNWFENLCPHKILHGILQELFIITKNLQKLKYPSIKWVRKKSEYIHTLQNYWALKEHKLSSHIKPWVNLKWISQSKRANLKWHILYGSICITLWKR